MESLERSQDSWILLYASEDMRTSLGKSLLTNSSSALCSFGMGISQALSSSQGLVWSCSTASQEGKEKKRIREKLKAASLSDL